MRRREVGDAAGVRLGDDVDVEDVDVGTHARHECAAVLAADDPSGGAGEPANVASTLPTVVIALSLTATSARTASAPRPSTTSPPRITS